MANLEAFDKVTNIRIRIAKAQADLASTWQDVAKKQIANASEVAAQQRISLAYRDFSRARRNAMGKLRRANAANKIVKEKQNDLAQMITINSSDSARRGWAAFKYFLSKASIGTRLSIRKSEDWGLWEYLRRKNLTPKGVAIEHFGEALELLTADAQTVVDQQEAELAELEAKLLEVRQADWKIANVGSVSV